MSKNFNDQAQKLERLAAWYRMQASHAAEVWIWEARLLAAEELERRAAKVRKQSTNRSTRRNCGNAVPASISIVPRALAPMHSSNHGAINAEPAFASSRANVISASLIMEVERKVAVAVITGASQGIGATLVEAYRLRGYRVVATARSIEQPVDADERLHGMLIEENLTVIGHPSGWPSPIIRQEPLRFCFAVRIAM